MAKNLTQWSSNDAQTSTKWTPASKSTTIWSNNDVKSLTQWSNNDVKLPTVWGITGTGSQSYFYDDPYMTYDMSNATYETLLNGNTQNQRVLTHWSPA